MGRINRLPLVSSTHRRGDSLGVGERSDVVEVADRVFSCSMRVEEVGCVGDGGEARRGYAGVVVRPSADLVEFPILLSFSWRISGF